MGAQWKYSGKMENASKRGAIFGKLVKEIMVSARLGGPEEESNFRLRTALEAAKKASVPKDTITRAIKRGAGLTGETIQYDSVTYEGFAPHQVPVIVECLTENKNRTAADIRLLFRKGQIGNSGSAAWMFDRLGVIEAVKEGVDVDIEESAIMAEAQNVEPMNEASDEVAAGSTGARFFTDPADLDAVSRNLTQEGWSVSFSELGYIAKNNVELTESQKEEVAEFLSNIQDNDDVHRIYTAVK